MSTLVAGETSLQISGQAADELVWTTLCANVGRSRNCGLADIIDALSASGVPLEVARRILTPSAGRSLKQ